MAATRKREPLGRSVLEPGFPFEEPDRRPGSGRHHQGYHPQIDYEAANLPLRVLFVITSPPTERSASVEDLLGSKGVVDVRETLTGRRNRYVEAVGTTTTEITRLTDSIHELGLEIEQSDITKQHRSQPFDQFHYEGDLVVDEVDEL